MSPTRRSSLVLALAASCAASSASAFAFAPAPNAARSAFRGLGGPGSVRLRMSDDGLDYPSDSSSEEHYDTDPGVVDASSEDCPPTEAESLIDAVLAELPALDGLSLVVDAATRSSINEALLRLERLSPTEDAARSPLLNGVWTLRYAGGYTDDWALPSPTRQLALFLYSGGYSPGLFALGLAQKLPPALAEVGDLEICEFSFVSFLFFVFFVSCMTFDGLCRKRYVPFLGPDRPPSPSSFPYLPLLPLSFPSAAISREQPRIDARIPVKVLGGAQNEVAVRARLDSGSSLRLTETYESATVLGSKVDLPQAAQYSRDLYVTYVDEDLLVVRDASGVPEVLVRK